MHCSLFYKLFWLHTDLPSGPVRFLNTVLWVNNINKDASSILWGSRYLALQGLVKKGILYKGVNSNLAGRRG
jgi:hypothetical protein